ncbi:MAG: M20/M25/M40 family metallo-hydrolase [Myxococcales bacterium]|nr:M20/M25/M40 family metallo-hydrolase [Myxococcales bacterium]
MASCTKKQVNTAPPVAPTPAPASTPAAAPAPRVSDDPVVQKIVELARADTQVHALLEQLTERFGPRLTSSHNLMAAERWARDQLAAWGLPARLDRWGEFPVGFDRGPQSGGMVAPERVDYEFTTRAWTPGVLGPARGRAVLLPETAREVTRDPSRYAGAWVVHPPRPDPRAAAAAAASPQKPGTKPAAKPAKPAKPLSKEAREKAEKARDLALREAGILGFVAPAWDSAGELVHTGGSYKISWGELPQDVQLLVRGDQHQDLHERLQRGEEVTLEFSVDNRFFRGPVPQHNVIAELVGSERPDEYVIVGGHLDSWDGATGTVDNGTGVATTLEAARLLVAAGAAPRRTIRFMLWSGEEQGLLGSRAYVKDHPDEMARISAVLVHDGGTNYLAGLDVTPEMMADMRRVFAPVQQLDPAMPFELVPAESLTPGGSDHSPFIQAGVPGFFWRQEGRSNYRCMHHTQHDTLPAAIPEYQAHSAIVVAIAAYNLANLPGLLDRSNSAPLPRRVLGVDLDGARVKTVYDDSPAKAAGLRAGDVVLAVAGEKVSGTRDVFRAVRRAGPTPTITLQRGRGDAAKELEIKLDFSADPAEAERAKRAETRRARFGDDALTPPTRERQAPFGDDEASCRPAAPGRPPPHLPAPSIAAE